MNRILPLAALAFLIVAGCDSSSKPSSSPGETTGTNASTPAQKSIKVGMLLDKGGRDDKSFNQAAYVGLERARKELGIEEKWVSSQSDQDNANNLEDLAEEGNDLVIAVGGAMRGAVEEVAKKYPEVKFAIVDADIKAPNVLGLLFAEEQGSYLAGYAAGLATKTNKIGFVGGMAIPLIKKFEVGYEKGAKDANPSVTMTSKYTESWVDTAAGRAAAAQIYSGGADVIYHASGKCGVGVIEAAKAANKLVIGVDSDQHAEAPNNVLTSMVKRVDVAVYQAIKDTKEGKFQAGSRVFDLKNDGVALADFRDLKGRIGPDGTAKIEAAKKKIIDGAITVPTR